MSSNQKTWKRFKEIVCAESYVLLASIMNNCVTLVFILIILNGCHIKDVTANSEDTTTTYLIIQDTTISLAPTVADDDLRELENAYSYHNSSTKERLKTIEGGVHNINIEPEYDIQRNKIVLNVSWDNLLDDPPVHYYDFKIIPNSSYPECRRKLFEIIKRNNTLTNFNLPPLLNPYEIYAGCTYIISLIADRSQAGKFKEDVVYTLPECVGRKCSCRYLSPQVNNISVIEFSPGKLNISWEINHEGTNETTYNITKILFEYRPTKNKNKPISPFSALGKPNLTYSIDYFILNEAYKIFTPKKLYELQATFYNTFDCKVINYTNFSINAVEVLHDAVEYVSKGFSWEIILLLTILAFFVLSAAYLIRRNRFILKEIFRNPLSLRFRRTQNSGDQRATSYIIIPSTIKRDHDINPLYVDKEIVEGRVDHYEFPRSRLSLLRLIGEGEFGQVHLGKALNIDDKLGYTFVAVKSIKEGAPVEEKDDFLQEIDIMKKVGQHPNIVKIFGCCQLKEPFLTIMEFVPCGDLRHYLVDLREKWKKQRSKDDRTSVFAESNEGAYIFPNTPRDRMISEGPSLAETEYTNISSDGYATPPEYYIDKVESTLDHTELQNFALQIAKGMEHLERMSIVHRDLAARNVLINEYKTLKVSDFGMSKISPYVSKKRNKMPLRWMALESMNNFYDSKGDVWSFAIVLWEIGTLGAFPYGNISDEMIQPYLQSGKRLERPEICTDELYSLMLRCWSNDSQLRPSFRELAQLLDLKKKHVYVDFSQLNPLYMFPPTKD